MTTSLHRLVADPEAFRKAWPDSPTVYDKDADDLRLLASRQAAREILADPDLRPGGFGMVRDGVLTAERPDADHPTDTLVLNGLHRSWPPLVTFCKALSTQLGHPVTGNVYLTPAGRAKGFGWHWDCHHVFIAQAEGAKRWRMFKPVFVNPLEHHNWSKIGFDPADRVRFEDDTPDFEVTLRAGQVLFIPRGWVHAGRSTESEHSLHITLGVQLLTVHWALRKLLELGEETEELRAALPPDLGGQDFLDLSAQLWALFVEWVTKQPAEPPALRLRSAQRLSVLNQEPK
ncbi:cupin domain-containing protein [Kitasatospora sp. NPDC004669]|uniref:JmjC domain-containing protein n=1 Tax=Kitasatospora sp. NPDC004669 TaxID=3154555 RepID=UPI0033B68B6D